MSSHYKYYILESSVLPEIFLKVMDAKLFLQSGKSKTVNDAVEKAGISRSAFYKYKDAIKPFFEMAVGRIITFQAILKDEPGVLSGILSHFAKSGANILTINQTIPINGQASVTISAQTVNMRVKLENMISKAEQLNGIIKFEIIASE